MVQVVIGTVKKAPPPKSRNVSSISVTPQEEQPSLTQKPIPSPFDVKQYQMIQDQTKKEPEPPVPEGPTSVTRQQLVQQMEKQQEDTKKSMFLQTIQHRIQTGKINVNEQYVMQESGEVPYGGSYGTGMAWSKGQILTGEQIITIMKGEEQERLTSYGQYRKETTKILNQIKSTPEGTLFYPVDNKFIAATPEMQELLMYYKSKGYTPEGGDVGFYESPVKPSDVLKKIKGQTGGEVIIQSAAAMNLGIPYAYSAVAQAFTKDDYIGRQYEEYAYRGLRDLPSKGETPGSAITRQLTSPDVIFDVYLPLATFGLGVAMKPVVSPFISKIAVKLAGYSTAKMIGGHYLKFSALTGAKILGYSTMAALPTYILGKTAFESPERLPSVAGRMTSQLLLAGASFKLGEQFYESRRFFTPSSPIQTPDTLLGHTPASVLRGQFKTETLGLQSFFSSSDIPFYSRVLGSDIEASGFATRMKIKDVVGGKPITHEFTVTSGELTYPSSRFIRGIQEQVKGDIRLGPTESDFLTGVYRQQFGLLSKPISSFSFEKPVGEYGRLFISKYRGFQNGTGFEGVAIARSFYSGESIIDTKGFLSQTKFDYDLILSRSTMKTGESIIDVSRLTKFRPKQKDVFSEPMGFDTGGITEFIPSDTMILPGGNLFTQHLSKFPSLTKLGGFPKMYSPHGITLSELERGLQYSSKWDTFSPRFFPKIPVHLQISSVLTSQMSSQLLSSRYLSSLLSLNILRPISISSNIQKSLSIQGSLSRSLQQELLIQEYVTPQVTIHPVSTPVVVPFSVPYSLPRNVYTPTTFKPYIWSIPSDVSDASSFHLPKSFGVGYRFRRWKVPRLEQLLKRGM